MEYRVSPLNDFNQLEEALSALYGPRERTRQTGALPGPAPGL